MDAQLRDDVKYSRSNAGSCYHLLLVANAGAMKLSRLVLALAPLSTWVGSAHAQPLPDCDTLPEPRVFIEAGDTQMTMLGELARRLRDAENPLTLIYLPRSTCTLADNYFHDKPTTESMRYAPSQAEAPSWDGVARECANKVGGYPIDLGIGATFISSCSSTVTSAQPANVKISNGPVQAYGFVVPQDSLLASQGGISWEEAYYVFSGQGKSQNVAPWSLDANPAGGTPTVFIRGAATSTLLTCSANVAPAQLPASMWQGYRLEGQADRSSVVVNGLKNQSQDLRDASIGIVGVDVYEANRDVLDFLAFQAPGQKFGFYPDSTPSRKDKRNVRDGHYVPWSYTQYIYRVGQDGAPVDPEVARVLAMASGSEEVELVSAPGVAQPYALDALQIFAQKGLVPECAMDVKRERDGSELSFNHPLERCGCFYESVVDQELSQTTAWQDRCISCDDDMDCDGGGACRHGYCERE